MNKHPQSDGLRAIADFLDNWAEEGLPEIPISFVYAGAEFSMSHEDQQRTATALRKRLPQMVARITDYQNGLVGEVSGVTLDVTIRKELLCRPVKVMREVTEWLCDGEAVPS